MDEQTAEQSLKGRLLVASPHAEDSPYRRAVMLVLEHSEQGAVGVVLDGSFRTSLAQLRAQIPKLNTCDRGSTAQAAMPVRIAKWKPGQVEQELGQGLWLNVVADHTLLSSDTIPEWSDLVREIGRAFYRELGIGGFPRHPSLN